MNQVEQKTAELVKLIRALDWFQFEKLLALLYTDSGYVVCRMGGAKADGGVDLLVEKPGKKGLVQCKHWRAWNVPVKEVRELFGAMNDHHIPNGVLVTVKGFTSEAAEFADRHGIVLYDEGDLVEMILNSSPEIYPSINGLLRDERKFCPRCERIMTLRTAKRGANPGRQFWGCSGYPGCKYIFNLDDSDKNEPIAARTFQRRKTTPPPTNDTQPAHSDTLKETLNVLERLFKALR